MVRSDLALGIQVDLRFPCVGVREKGIHDPLSIPKSEKGEQRTGAHHTLVDRGIQHTLNPKP
jgi:hypothetical protein